MNKGFYKNASTMSPFQFDRIYPNRKTMEEERNKDGVFIGRYVLIEYNDDSEEYTNNSEIDLTNYEKTYDSTIWQKIYDKENNEEKYVQIASLDTPLPKVETKIVSPGTKPLVDIDYTTSPETYEFSLPKAWGFEVKKAGNGYSDEADGDNKLNIYYNKNAFDNISFKEIDSSVTWEPYKYYSKFENNTNGLNLNELLYENKNDEKYYLSPETARSENTYYEKIPYLKNEGIGNKISLENANNEIKELSLILPGLGNAAAEIYDLLYKDGENRNSFIYSSIEENQNMYDANGNPLYNSNEKSVVGLMNKVYDIIGRMKIKDLPDELNDDTIEDSDLVNTLFKKDKNYYLVIKYLITENNEEKQVYKAELFNEKSLYHLIAEMQHLVSGSYESIFDALDNELQINEDNSWIEIEKDIDNKLSYTIKHSEFAGREEGQDYVTYVKILDRGITIKDYLLDKAGHVTTTETTSTTYYMPAAYNNSTIPKIDNEINETVIPIGSIWYDTSS